MDPETLRLLLVALVGVGGAAVGAWINQHGAGNTAQRTLQGQRVLARDQAVRVWRTDHVVKPLLDAAYERRAVSLELVQVADQMRQEADEARKTMWQTEQVQRLYTLLLREKRVTNIAYRSIEADAFSTAVANLSQADGRCVDAAAAVLADRSNVSDAHIADLEAAAKELTAAIVAMEREGERYIHQLNL